MTEPRKSELVLGVDGGGTSTRVVLATPAGEILAAGEAGPGNLRDVGEEILTRHVAAALEAAWQRAPGERRPAAAAFLGIASVVRERERDVTRRVAAKLRLAPAARVGVGHDLEIAWAGGLSGRPGIVVIAGTGSSCYGRRADGESWRAGGWGSFLDDGGSSFDLGRRALIACIRAEDRRGPATQLRSRVMEALGLTELREVLGALGTGDLPRTEVAGLAPLVTAAAAEGDAVAREILAAGAEELALAVAAVAGELRLEDPEVALCGGLAQSGPTYREPLSAAIRRRLPQSRVLDPELPPAVGAALLAARLLDPAVSKLLDPAATKPLNPAKGREP